MADLVVPTRDTSLVMPTCDAFACGVCDLVDLAARLCFARVDGVAQGPADDVDRKRKEQGASGRLKSCRRLYGGALRPPGARKYR